MGAAAKLERSAEKVEAVQSVQTALDRYIESRRARIEEFVAGQLDLKECLAIQKRHLVADLVRNPINAFWAIPSLSIRKGLEVSEKLGWAKASSLLPRIPQAFRTGFQMEVEKLIAQEIFGVNDIGRSALARELEIDPGLKEQLGKEALDELVGLAEAELKSEIRSHCSKQNGFTDLVASTGVVLFADKTFGDSSLDVFGLGRKFASLWARKDAENGFFLGKSLGRAFYSVAPPPPPTTTQVFLTTTVAILLLALFSTAVGVLSYPVQTKLGFRRKQLDLLVESVGDKLLLKLTKHLKRQKT